jgi:glycosyltransferase involved in cell wall biosynthesis
MKILFIHDFYQGFGGEDAVALAERRLLGERGHQVVYYTRHNNEIKQYKFWDKVAFFPRTLYSLRTRREIEALVRAHKPDVAYIHNVFPLISPSVYHTLYRLRVPTVQVVHDFRFWCPNGIFYTHGQACERCKHGNYLNALARRCYRNSYTLSALYSASVGLNRLRGLLGKIDGFVCLTEFSKQKLLESGVAAERIFLKPNFTVAPPVDSVHPGRGNRHVLYLGRLSAEKGLWTLMHAFERLPSVMLKVAGTGPLEAVLKEYVQNKAMKNVIVLGFRDGREKSELLANSLFTVLPSEWCENFPLVALEAYAAGKPVVGSRLGSLPHVIEENKSGILFQPGCVDDLVNKVRYLLDRPDEADRMGRYARSLVETTYSPAACYQRLMSIFSSVCNRA